MWDQLSRKIKRILKDGHSAVKVTPDDVAAFEAKYDVALPKSYVSFLYEFGPGTCNHYFNIYGPLTGYRGRELNSEVREIRVSKVLASIYGDPALLERCIPFGDTIAGDIFAWDPAQTTRDKRGEYPIVVLPRYGKTILSIASDFGTFVRKVCYGHAFEDVVMGERDPEWEINFIFEPTSKRQTKPAGGIKKRGANKARRR